MDTSAGWPTSPRAHEDDLVRQLLEAADVDDVIARMEGDHYRHLHPVMHNLTSFDDPVDAAQSKQQQPQQQQQPRSHSGGPTRGRYADPREGLLSPTAAHPQQQPSSQWNEELSAYRPPPSPAVSTSTSMGGAGGRPVPSTAGRWRPLSPALSAAHSQAARELPAPHGNSRSSSGGVGEDEEAVAAGVGPLYGRRPPPALPLGRRVSGARTMSADTARQSWGPPDPVAQEPSAAEPRLTTRTTPHTGRDEGGDGLLADPTRSRVARQLQLLRNYRELAELCAQTSDPRHDLFRAIPPEQLARLQVEELCKAQGRESSPVTVLNHYYFHSPPPGAGAVAAGTSEHAGLRRGAGGRRSRHESPPGGDAESARGPPRALSGLALLAARPPLQSPAVSTELDSPLAANPHTPAAAVDRSPWGTGGAPVLSPAPSPPPAPLPRGKPHRGVGGGYPMDGVYLGDPNRDTLTATTEEAGTSYGEDDDQYPGDFLDEDEEETFFPAQGPHIIEREQHRRLHAPSRPLPGTMNVTLNPQFGVTPNTGGPARSSSGGGGGGGGGESLSNAKSHLAKSTAAADSSSSGSSGSRGDFPARPPSPAGRSSKAASMINVLSGEHELLTDAAAHRRSSAAATHHSTGPAGSATGPLGAHTAGGAGGGGGSGGGPQGAGGGSVPGAGVGVSRRRNSSSGETADATGTGPHPSRQHSHSRTATSPSRRDVAAHRSTPERRYKLDEAFSDDLDDTPFHAQLQTQNPSASAAHKQKQPQRRRPQSQPLRARSPQRGPPGGRGGGTHRDRTSAAAAVDDDEDNDGYSYSESSYTLSSDRARRPNGPPRVMAGRGHDRYEQSHGGDDSRNRYRPSVADGAPPGQPGRARGRGGDSGGAGRGGRPHGSPAHYPPPHGPPPRRGPPVSPTSAAARSPPRGRAPSRVITLPDGRRVPVPLAGVGRGGAGAWPRQRGPAWPPALPLPPGGPSRPSTPTSPHRGMLAGRAGYPARPSRLAYGGLASSAGPPPTPPMASSRPSDAGTGRGVSGGGGRRGSSPPRLQAGLLYGSLLPNARSKTALVLAEDERGLVYPGGVDLRAGTLLPVETPLTEDAARAAAPSSVRPDVSTSTRATVARVGGGHEVQPLVWQSGNAAVVVGRNRRVPPPPKKRLSLHHRPSQEASATSLASVQPNTLALPDHGVLPVSPPSAQRAEEQRQKEFREQQTRQQAFLRAQKELEQAQQPQRLASPAAAAAAAGLNPNQARYGAAPVTSRRASTLGSVAQATAQRFGIAPLNA